MRGKHIILQVKPKGPPVLRIPRRVNSAQAVKFGMEIRKRYGDCSEMLFFSRGKETEIRYGSSKTTAIREYYEFWRRSIFSTEGSFKNKTCAHAIKMHGGVQIDTPFARSKIRAYEKCFRLVRSHPSAIIHRHLVKAEMSLSGFWSKSSLENRGFFGDFSVDFFLLVFSSKMA